MIRKILIAANFIMVVLCVFWIIGMTVAGFQLGFNADLLSGYIIAICVICANYFMLIDNLERLKDE